jgi:Fe-S cluster assembly scaffold protein SufB
MAYAKDQEHQDLRVRTMFEGREGAGEVVMKGVAEGRASIKAHGLIAIGPQGGGTNTYLTQNVLMLDASAKVDSVPSLEIKTNDVKASHSATVSRVTAEDLFYFASRGISAHEAKRMFVEGFLGDLTSRIADIALRERIAAMVGEKYARA